MSLSQLRFQYEEDPDVLKLIHREYPNCVLVTTDDHLPEDHADLVARYKPTVAIIDPNVGSEFEQDPEQRGDQWEWDMCMRWAHRMQEQESRSIRRYNARGSHVWRRPRTPRPIAKARQDSPASPTTPVVEGMIEHELVEKYEQLSFREE